MHASHIIFMVVNGHLNKNIDILYKKLYLNYIILYYSAIHCIEVIMLTDLFHRPLKDRKIIICIETKYTANVHNTLIQFVFILASFPSPFCSEL